MCVLELYLRCLLSCTQAAPFVFRGHLEVIMETRPQIQATRAISPFTRTGRYSLLGANLLRQQEQTNLLFRERLLSITEASVALGGLTSATVRRWIQAGHVRATRVGKLGHFKVPASEIRRLKGEGQNG